MDFVAFFRKISSLPTFHEMAIAPDDFGAGTSFRLSTFGEAGMEYSHVSVSMESLNQNLETTLDWVFAQLIRKYEEANRGN